MKINYSIVALLPVAVLLAPVSTSCSDSKGGPPPTAEVVYQATAVRKANVGSELVLPGELEGFFETSIMAKVNGYVKLVHADIGDQVRQGQKLADLEAPELKSQLEAAHAELLVKEAVYLNTKGKLKRLIQTNKTQGAVSPYDMDLALTQVKSDSLSFAASVSSYQAVKSLSDYLLIIAPFDGIITERGTAPGDFVGPGDKAMLPLFRLKSESKLRLHVAVPEKRIAEIKTGDEVTFQVKSYPDQFFKGKITRLAENINTQTRSEMVEIEIDNRSRDLLPGMYANVSIPLMRRESTLVVPVSAVVTNMERSFVIKVTRGRMPVWVDVQKGEEQKGMVEVFGLLTPGDTVLSTATDEIRERNAISIVMTDR